MTTSCPPQPDIRSLLENGFDEETANHLYDQGKEIVIFALLQLAALALKTQDINGTHPSTPAATPTYQKEPGKKRKKKPGAKPGHKGSRRPPPIVNRYETHLLGIGAAQSLESQGSSCDFRIHMSGYTSHSTTSSHSRLFVITKSSLCTVLPWMAARIA